MEPHELQERQMQSPACGTDSLHQCRRGTQWLRCSSAKYDSGALSNLDQFLCYPWFEQEAGLGDLQRTPPA